MATPPGGARPRAVRRQARPYAGPPAYPAVPRWGFPALAWRWPLALPTGPAVDPVRRVAALYATATSTLWIIAGMGGLTAVAELWRYVLLLRSRGEALPATTLAVSDALVVTTGVLTLVLGALAGVVVVLWALRAREAATERIGVRSARSDAQFVLGVLVPGLNLVVAGSSLSELEHAVLVGEGARERGARPRPSRLVLVWWAAWVASLLLGWTAFLWGFRSGTQALADGVVLHVWTNIAVVVLAVVTIRVVRYLTTLLVPADPTELPHLRVLGLRDAPAPPRPPRPADAQR
ncbi:uncharacterized protein DUF4328 [Saccharopolyspora erythraea NRRL 2338]|uniref:Possible membrane protein n=2 Tax=Saccharopolyspora erythraea TaxID=1836 RepID=A4F603_SACEN|nr:DUF4328 domain-containing protein [Saccharopolyspora erythraea]PFG93276.1 uncharacterized protein DUF4328 [Saccharopolyspora erythraea NRRL 2338]QRK90125.1 DUF4328 domain-containing protein [Saccharopolyspora erythraea]CAL99477.1 possible membrane protein [Saccharopolyspora erythraea NRRL 2338]